MKRLKNGLLIGISLPRVLEKETCGMIKMNNGILAKTLSKQVFLVAEGSRMDAYHKLDIEPLITADQEEAYADAYWLDALH